MEYSDENSRKDVLLSGETAGLVSVTYEGRPVRAFSVTKLGTFDNVARFEIVNPETVFPKNSARQTALRKMQFFFSRGGGKNLQFSVDNGIAMHFSLWRTINEVTFPVPVKAYWSSRLNPLIETDIKAIEPTPFSGVLEDAYPTILWLQVTTGGARGLMAPSVAMANTSKGWLGNQTVIVSNIASSGRVITEDKGKATAVDLPDPLPGRPQMVRAFWEGSIPAGTLLRAVYKSTPATAAGQGYLITTENVAASISINQVRPGGKC